jgi:hypothetical protein
MEATMRMIRNFAADRRGNVAMMFGLAALPVLAGVGATVDYGRAALARERMQAAADAAILAVAKEAGRLPQAQLEALADRYFRANFIVGAGFDLSPVRLEIKDRTVRLQASGAVKAAFMPLFRVPEIAVATASEAMWGTKRIELALVLDNTGSMGSAGKMDALKDASKALIDTLETAARQSGAGSVKISIVPFDANVRVGTTHLNATWLAFDPANADPRLRAVRDASWTGCVTDRAQPYDVRADAPVAWTPATLYLGVNCGWGAKLAAIRPLTENFADLRQTVNAMQPSGCTNVTIGTHWGLATLTPGAPMTGAAAMGTKDVEKIMIVLTDGWNTQNRWVNGCSSSGNPALIDQRTQLACAEARTAKVQVYTVRVIEGSETLLRNCASKPSMYFNVQNVNQLKPVFQSIADQIAGIRLTS